MNRQGELGEKVRRTGIGRIPPQNVGGGGKLHHEALKEGKNCANWKSKEGKNCAKWKSKQALFATGWRMRSNLK